MSAAPGYLFGRLRKVTIREAILLTSYAFAAAFLLELASDYLKWVKGPLEFSAMALFYSSYWVFWILLILAPFRPHKTFSLHGECKVRAVNLGLAIIALAAVHLVIVAMIVSALA